MTNINYSMSPDGERFQIPTEDEYFNEYHKIKDLVDKERSNGNEIVVVMGVGFVGIVMAAVVADSKDEKAKHGKFVIGMQKPSIRSY